LALRRGERGRSDVPSALDDEPTGDRVLDFPDRGPGTANAGPAVRVSVSVDTLIVRSDLGPGVSTFVAAGGFVPVGLEGFSRVPA
jgi:hypothetical protein